MLDVNQRVLSQVLEGVTRTLVSELAKNVRQHKRQQTRPVVLDLNKHKVKFNIYLDVPKN